MKAAIVSGPGQMPRLGDHPEPVAGPGEVLVRVTASAISHITRGHAEGRHYSAGNRFPFIAGLDGTGRLPDGRRVWFALPRPPFGSLAELAPVPQALCIDLPDDLDDATAAALAIPAMSSWLALAERAVLRPGETVLIQGATGTSGRLAVQIARHLGAGRVIATGRNPAALQEVAALGADAVLTLDDEAGLRAELARGVNVVLDYLWGKPAETLLIAAAKAGREAPLRYVHIGSVAGEAIALPGAVLRAAPITLMGSGTGSVPLPRLIAVVDALFRAARPAGLKIAFTPVPFVAFDTAWAQEIPARTVFVL